MNDEIGFVFLALVGVMGAAAPWAPPKEENENKNQSIHEQQNKRERVE